MIAGHSSSASSRACASCLRRGWLLARLSAGLDRRACDLDRLMALLALDDEELLRALAGSRRATLEADYGAFDPQNARRARGVEALCVHDRGYPGALRHPAAPRMLHVQGGVERLAKLASAPLVAIVGSARATDYGMETARTLARGLAACGVTVLNGSMDGIAVAAQAGVLEGGGRGLSVVGGGLDVAHPARRRALHARLIEHGCAVSELPCGCDGRRWGPVAAERITARLAQLVVVVEAREDPRELAPALIARQLGRIVAAIPGRVTSSASSGTHALLIDGARLVRGPADVLELLHPRCPPAPSLRREETARLTAPLREVLELVGAGRDTPGKLIDGTHDAAEVLLALSQLELMGLLARGDGGRYLPLSPI
jgi:DNA processing protein